MVEFFHFHCGNISYIFKYIFNIYYYIRKPILINIEKNNRINNVLLNTVTNSHNFVFNANFGILTQDIPKKVIKNPYISIVIPMFNSENYIKRTILSIQNQNLTEYEVIIIDDFSSDNSSEIVKKFGFKDKRIKIINNEKHMGQFYSRNIGALLSKGKYILPLDSDDMYLIHDTFYFVNNELNKNNPDFLLFKGIRSLNFSNFFINKDIFILRDNIKNNEIIYQPRIAMNYGQCSLQATCINENLYRKIINSYNGKHLYDNITYCEDCITNHIMHEFAKSCELFPKIGYLYIYRKSSHSHRELNIYKRKSEIYYIDVLYKYAKICNKSKMFALKKLSKFIKNSNFKYFIKENKTKNIIKSLIIKIKNDKSIPSKAKKFINIDII